MMMLRTCMLGECMMLLACVLLRTCILLRLRTMLHVSMTLLARIALPPGAHVDELPQRINGAARPHAGQ